MPQSKYTIMLGITIFSILFTMVLAGDTVSARVAELIKQLENPSKDARWNAIDSLQRIGSDAKPAVPALVKMLKDNHAQIRSLAAISFNQIVPPHVDIFKVCPETRYFSEIPRPELLPPACRARLAEATRIADEQAAKAAAIAVPALIKALQDEDDSVRQNSALSLGACGRYAASAVPALIQALQDGNDPASGRAVEALGRIGLDANEAVWPLMDYVKKYKRYDVRTPAIRALGQIGPQAKDSVPLLINLLRDPQEPRYPAAEALGNIGPAAAAAIPALLAALEDEERLVRASAASALGKIGINTQSVVVALKKSEKDPDSYVRTHAARALHKIVSAEEMTEEKKSSAEKDN